MSITTLRAWNRRLAAITLALALLLSAPSVEAKKKSSTTYAKVKVAVAKMYKTTKNKKVFVRLKKGTVVIVVGVHGKWAKVKRRGRVGYMLTKRLVKVKSKAVGADATASSFARGVAWRSAPNLYTV